MTDAIKKMLEPEIGRATDITIIFEDNPVVVRLETFEALKRGFLKLMEQRDGETERYQLSRGMSHEQTFHFIQMDGRNFDSELLAAMKGE